MQILLHKTMTLRPLSTLTKEASLPSTSSTPRILTSTCQSSMLTQSQARTSVSIAATISSRASCKIWLRQTYVMASCSVQILSAALKLASSRLMARSVRLASPLWLQPSNGSEAVSRNTGMVMVVALSIRLHFHS